MGKQTLTFPAYARWNPKDQAAAMSSAGLFASQRLRKDIFWPVVEPEFKISRDDSLFAMGSCFARGIEGALKGRGFAMESAASDFDAFELADNRKMSPLGFTNKYTTYSMLNELEWALDPNVSFPEDSLVDLDEGVCIDPHINPTLKGVDRIGTLGRRRIIEDVVRRVSRCRVMFFTLGLVEVWHDSLAGTWLNSTPTPAMRQKYPDRYHFHVTGYQDNFQNLEKIHEVLAKYGCPDVRIIVTVSPVPLNATFSGQDIVLANTYSKSTLRVVAGEWASKHENVQYFPSYEIVMNSSKELAWEEDLRHVKGKMTQRIMDYFMQSFVE